MESDDVQREHKLFLHEYTCTCMHLTFDSSLLTVDIVLQLLYGPDSLLDQYLSAANEFQRLLVALAYRILLHCSSSLHPSKTKFLCG